MTEKSPPELGELFLTNFIETIIENIKPSPVLEGEYFDPLLAPVENHPPRIMPIQNFQRTSSVISNPIPRTQFNQMQNAELTSPLSYQNLNPRVLNADSQSLMPSLTNSYQAEQFPYERPQTIRPINLRPFPSSFTQVPEGAFRKISQLLNNPSIMSIECQGPGKNLIINKGGMMQASHISLTEVEIDEIMNDFSSKTRIPLIKGVFKAALGNIIISAVISEFVGTRFHVEKMKRPMSYMR